MSKLKEISFEKEKKVINKMVELFKQTREQINSIQISKALCDISSKSKNKTSSSTMASKQNECQSHSCLLQRMLLSGDLKQISSHVQEYQQKVLRLVHELTLKNDVLIENNQKIKRQYSMKY